MWNQNVQHKKGHSYKRKLDPKYIRVEIQFLLSHDCCVALPHGAMGLSAVCDCGIFWSYYFFTTKNYNIQELQYRPRHDAVFYDFSSVSTLSWYNHFRILFWKWFEWSVLNKIFKGSLYYNKFQLVWSYRRRQCCNDPHLLSVGRNAPYISYHPWVHWSCWGNSWEHHLYNRIMVIC